MEKVILKDNDKLKGGVYEKIEVRGKNVTIDGVRVEGEGICLYSNYNCSGLTVSNSTFVSRGNNAVKVVADKVSDVIKRVMFYGCKFEFARMGMEIQNHGNNTYKVVGMEITDCDFTALDGSDYRYGLSLSGYGKDVQVQGCSFKRCVKGIEVVGFSDVDVSNCNLYGSGYAFITSNKRKMEGIIVHDCEIDGMVRFQTCEGCVIYDSEVKGGYIELKKSTGLRVHGCTVTSGGHYSVMINDAKDCIVEQNVFNQGKKNWAVVRCYGKEATGNIIRNNTYNRKPKNGKVWDEENGAKGNIFIS